MFLTMGCMSAVLMLTYVQHNRRIKAYVTAQTSDLLHIIQTAQARMPTTSNLNQALNEYMNALREAGLSQVELVSPSG
jgi:hypothetical protein